MNTRIKIVCSLCFLVCFACAQQVSAVYKIGDLLKRIHKTNDTVYVLNFWATWCVPCVKEMPQIDSFAIKHKNEKVKVIIVSLDFKEELDKKVNPFLQKNKYQVKCVLLDEINGNDFINKVDTRWSGSIPATLFTFSKGRRTVFKEQTLTKTELESALQEFR